MTRRLSANVSRTAGRHRGAAMVYVLVLLLLISMIGATMVRGAVALHRQRRHDELHAQTVRAAEAGWNRAVRKLVEDANYTGETWSIPADLLTSNHAAEVRIELVASEDDSARELHVTAEYPVGSPQVTRITLTVPASPTPGFEAK